MNPLQQCHQLGQSLWFDFISRDLLASGGLARLIRDDGINGVTSNPAIFEKAIAATSDYDAALAPLVAAGERDPERLFESLAIADIVAAADALHGKYVESRAQDGYVSLEVSPQLALDESATVAAARRLWKAVARPNLMIKVPGTPAGAGALRQLIADGINVNVTLLFARSAYAAVAQAYLEGLEQWVAQGGDPARVASVASFFVSRIDSAMDAEINLRLSAADDAQRQALTALLGQVAIANAKLAYADYQRFIAQPRWQALAAKGAQPQRLLWASTGTKNPAYRDVIYVEALLGPQTVNTVPPATLDAFRDHGVAQVRLTEGLDAAKAVFASVERLQLPLDAITERLVVEGLKLFADAHDSLLKAVAGKRDALLK
ncbi:MAG TPA: transaldolase [Fontimonas sp.]